MLLVPGVDRELAHPLALAAGPGHEVDPLQLAARLGDRRRQLAQRLLPRVELDPDRDAVLGADGHRGPDRFVSRDRFRPGAVIQLEGIATKAESPAASSPSCS